MSGFKNAINEMPKKPWKDFSSDEMRRFHLKNVKKYDCGFKSEDPDDKKVYKSFKWILCELSPVLKEMLDDEKNRAKDCKEIIISNPKHIEAVLFFGHFKVVNTKIMNLVDFYGASKEYQVKALEDDVIKMFNNSPDNRKNQDWVKLFWLSYVKYPEDKQMRLIFEKVVEEVGWSDTFAESNIDLIMEFDEELFDIFFDIMVKRRVESCYKITESYLIQHIFEENTDIKLEHIDPSERDLVEWYINKINLGTLYWENYKNGPLVSNLLTTKHKIENLKIVKKQYTSSNKQLIFNEIESCIQKLSEAESNIKTEKMS